MLIWFNQDNQTDNRNYPENELTHDKKRKVSFARQKSGLNSTDLGFDRQLSDDCENESEILKEKV